jgi:hypothetical protein
MPSIDNVWGFQQNRPGVPFLTLATDDGTPSGSADMTGNYATTPADFWVQPEPGEAFFITMVRLIMPIPPSSPDCDDYGQLNGGLLNGIQLFRRFRGVEALLNPSIGPAKNHVDLARLGFTIFNTQLNGASLVYTFDLSILEKTGLPLPIFGDQSDRVGVRLNDNHTSQDFHELIISGFRKARTRAQQP